jgi:hypothetical protein
VENVVTSWETSDADFDDPHHRNFVLKQPSRVGPWLALGLSGTLVAVLGYLVSVNLLLPPLPPLTPERALHSEAELASPVSRLKHTNPRALERRMPAVTVVPQGRAPNALLGGQGPALPPAHAMPSDMSLSPRLPTQNAAGRQ